MPLTWLTGVLAVCAVGLLAVAITVQVVRADTLAVKPHLGIQADGGRRLEYNPRVVDLVRSIPRGSIYDRNGLPLATDERPRSPPPARSSRSSACRSAPSVPRPGNAAIPLGARAYHVVGDARTRLNWSASNTSFVERDADDRLQGFSDHDAPLATTNAGGQPMFTIRRDYRDLVPVLRHRHEPEHSAIVALRKGARDVRLTIDAGLQAPRRRHRPGLRAPGAGQGRRGRDRSRHRRAARERQLSMAGDGGHGRV